MNNGKQEQEISLKRMFLSVAYRWKVVLVAALILAVLVGAVQGIRFWQREAAAEPGEYQVALESYEREKMALDKQIAGLQGEVDYQRQYLNESVLMQLDYYDIQEAKVSLYVSTDYQIMPGMEYQNTDDRGTMLNVYHAALTGDKLLSEVAQTVGMETKYLKELVDITTSRDRIISIYVWHTDSRTAQQIRDLLLEQMDKVGESITQSIGEHTMYVVNDSVGVIVDVEVADQQDMARERLEKSEKALAQTQTELNGLTAPADPAAAGKTAAGVTVKWAIIGAVLGAVLAAVAICCGFVFGDRVDSAEELKCRFGMKIIGSVWTGKKRCDPISARLMAAEGRVSHNTEGNLDLVAANIGAYAGNARLIILAGAMEEQSLVEQLQRRLPDRTLIPCGDLMTDAAAVRQLSGCEGVLLLEKRGVSRYSGISREMERVRDGGKYLIGCIFAER